MHNLRNVKRDRYAIESANLTATAWDVTDDSLLLAFGPTKDDQSITLKRLPDKAGSVSDATTISSWDAPSPNPDLAVDRILDLHYFPDTKSITLVLAGGDIVVVREEPQSDEDIIEIVGSVDAGIQAAAWSPDEELLAVSTTAGTLLLMTRAFESVTDFSYSIEDQNASAHVSVGWGKKETQFKGRGVAKILRDPTVPEHIDEGNLHPSDDGRITICWRGDGQFLAVNCFLDTEPKRRIIRIFSREGVLEGVSEPVDGLDGALSWKPSGQTIAGLQREDDSARVIFFERNGLRHGEFELRLSKEDLASFASTIQLSWNVDSTVLAVTLKDCVQLWTMGNYHYYLKQVINLSATSSTGACTSWHPEKPLHLIVADRSYIHTLSYRFEVCRGSVSPPNDLGAVAVIDGKTLKVTPLRFSNVPPPMAFDEIELSTPALDVTINERGDEISVLHEDTVSTWECNYFRKPAMRATLKRSVPRYVNANAGASQLLVEVSSNLYVRTDHDRISYEDNAPNEIAEGLPMIKSTITNLDPTTSTWLAPKGAVTTIRASENGILHVKSAHQTLRISGCTSYVLTQTHLIYTTSQHLLKFIHLHDGELTAPADEPEKDERCRTIERGAKIVTVIPTTYSLILQMPRGNLETIYPRVLVLSHIRNCIRNRDYKKAFLTCRTHRVDMNILHDYMPEQMMNDVELFIKQLKKIEYIDLFLSSLSEEDVSQNMYRETLAPIEPPVLNGLTNGVHKDDHRISNSKINRICNAFLGALNQHPHLRLQNVVTAHVCKNPPDLEAGLGLVSKLRSQGDDSKLEAAVDHICFLADVNQLYDTALGLYDVEVALLVAQQAQRDPREYLPYLEALHKMQPLRMRFTIDDDLKRHEKAIGHLHMLDAFEEVKAYTEKHELYPTTLHFYRYDQARLNELMHLHADFLASRNRYSEAGIAYEFVADHKAAYTAYRSANMWQECLANASLVPLTANDIASIAEDLADSLVEAKDYTSAATIHLDYLQDLESAAKLLCKGYRFSDTMRLVTQRQRPELLKSVVDSGLIDASASITETLSEMKSQLGAQVPRLRELRQRKIDDPMAFLDGGGGDDVDIPDDLSVAPTDASTTGGTFMTRYTNRSTGTLATNATRKTSKNRRREERKRARGKKGTVYEEEYLENSIGRLMERLNEMGSDIAQLMQCLMRRGMRERAIAVKTLTADTFDLCESCMDEVFGKGMRQESGDAQAQAPDDGELRPWGGEGVLWDAMKQRKREAPKLQRPIFTV